MKEIPHNMALTPVEFHIFRSGKKKGPVIAATPGSLSVKPGIGQDISVDALVSGKVIGLYGKTLLNPDVGLAVHLKVSEETVRSLQESPASWKMLN